MRRPAVLLIVIVAVLFTGLAAFALALRSQAFVLAALEWSVSAFTSLRLELREPSVDVYGGHFSAREIHLVPQGTEGPALLSVIDLDLRCTAAGSPEAAGRLALSARQVLIYTSEHSEAQNPEPMRWIQYLAWLPDSLRVGQVHVITAAARTFIFPLKNLRGDRLSTERYRVTAEADYEGEPLRVTLDLLSLFRESQLRGVTFDLVLASLGSGSGAVLHGDLVGTLHHFRYDATLAASYRDIAEFMQGFAADTPLAGALTLRAGLSGDAEGFQLSDAHFVLDNMPAYGFEVDGRLDYRLDGQSRLDLTGGGELSSVDYLVNWLDLDLGTFGRVQATVKLGGSLDRPVVQHFRLLTDTRDGLTLGMAGSMDLFEAPGETSSQEIFVDVSGPSLAVLSPWVGPLPYETGPWAASGLVRGDRHTVSISDLVVELGRYDGARLRATGRIGQVKLGSPAGKDTPAERADGVDLQVAAHIPDSAELAGMLHVDLPPTLALDGRVRITGNDRELSLDDGAATVTAPGIEATLTAGAARLHPGGDAIVSDFGGQVQVAAENIAALSPLLGFDLPAVGPLRATGRLDQQSTAFRLQDLDATLGIGAGSVLASGSVGDILNLRDVSLAIKLDRLDTRRLLSLLRRDFSYEKDLGALSGGFTLARRRDTWNAEMLELRNDSAGGPLQLTAKGDIRDLFGLPTANLEAALAVPDPDLLQALTGMPMKPVSGTLRMTSEGHRWQGTLGMQIGATAISSELDITHKDREITSLKIRIATPELHLEDLTSGFAAASLQDSGESERPDRIGQLLLRSPRYPLDITIDIGGISGDNTSIDSLTLRLIGSDNRFILQDFTVVYDQSRAEFRGVIDLSVDPPALSLGGQATALPLDSMVKDLAIDTDLSGALTLRGGATVTGSSGAQMLGNLNGTFSFALEDARIQGAAYDLLATDVLAWIYSGAMTDKSTYLDCAMAKFDIASGVATTDSLYVESPRMVALGKLKLDLVRQRMDLTLLPMSKSRTLQVPSTVRLKGPLTSPKAEVSALAAAADATAAAITLIPDLLRRVFGGDAAAQRQRPCEVAPAG